MVWDCLLDALIDSVKILPILLVVYLFVSYFSHKKGAGYTKFAKLTKKAGPLVGAVLGVVPQCGFSAVMADLYSKKTITIGTLVAVFLATSDEAIPIMISNIDFLPQLLTMIGIKFIFALICGFLIDVVLNLLGKRKRLKKSTKLCSDERVNIIEKNIEEKTKHECDEEDCCCSGSHIHSECDEEHDHCCADNIFLDALKHSLNITFFLLIATFIINIVIESAGIDRLTQILGGNQFLQILISGIVGFIPNCASSVFLVEFYMAGGISFGAFVTGLSVGAGVGYLVLFRRNKKIIKNLGILALVYVLSVCCGLIVNFFNIFA